MARALERPGLDPTYLEFFGLRRPPFTRLTRPSDVFHTEQYSLLMSHLDNATKQSDCLVVVCGADGCGKTTLLNRYVASLGEDICFAKIDESYKSVKQFYCEFLRQLGFRDINGKPDELRRISREFLVNRGMAGEPILLMIDNAHLIHPNVFEQLRWLAAIKVDEIRVLSSIIAGNSDLVRVMDSPAMSQLAFSSYVRFHIRAFSEEETANYIWTRLKLAGGVDSVTFSNEAHPLIHRYTGGIPRLINILCDAALAEAHARETRTVTDELLRTVADSRQLVPHVLPHKGTGRRRTDPDFKLAQARVQSLGEAELQGEFDEVPANDSENLEPDSKTNDSETDTSKQEVADVDIKNLFQRLASQSQQVEDLTADRIRTLEEISTRDSEINELQEQLGAQSIEAEILARTIGDNTDRFERLDQALSVSTDALYESERASMQLAADLEKEKAASTTTQIEFTAVDEEVAGLKCQLSDAAEAIADLLGDLELANERIVETDALEKLTATLNDDNEKTLRKLHSGQGKLAAQDEVLADREKLLAESQKECVSLRAGVAAWEKQKDSISEKDARIADLEATLATHDQDIKELEAKNAKLDKESQAREEELSRLNSVESDLLASQEKIVALEQRFESRDSNRKDSISEKDARIADLEATLATHDQDIKDLEAKNANLDKESQTREEELSRLNSVESDLHASLEKIDALEQRFESRDEDRKNSISEKDAWIADLKATLATHDQDIKELEAKNAELDNVNQAREEELSRLSSVESDLIVSLEKIVALEQQFESRDSELSKVKPIPVLESEPQDADAKQPTVTIKAFEIFKDGEIKGVMEVQEGQRRIMIGRNEDNDLYLDSRFVSGHHAMILCAEHGIRIEDLHSRNGTLVNAHPISRCKLLVGDVVTIGEYQIRPGPA